MIHPVYFSKKFLRIPQNDETYQCTCQLLIYTLYRFRHCFDHSTICILQTRKMFRRLVDRRARSPKKEMRQTAGSHECNFFSSKHTQLKIFSSLTRNNGRSFSAQNSVFVVCACVRCVFIPSENRKKCLTAVTIKFVEFSKTIVRRQKIKLVELLLL